MKPELKNSGLCLPGFNTVRTDGPPKKAVSTNCGILFAITKEIMHKEVPTTCLRKTFQFPLPVIRTETIEPGYLAVFSQPVKRITYQIPLEDFSFLFDFLETQLFENFILTGDFNVPETSWETYQSSNDYDKTIIIFAFHNNLKQLVHVKTTASYCLDLVFTTNGTLINSVRTETLDNFSDHDAVVIQVSLNKKTRKTSRVQYQS